MRVADAAPERAVSGARFLARNGLLNLMSLALPVGVAVVATPVLVRQLGAERYGLVALLWLIVGYLGLFDLGMGQATTKLTADQLADARLGRVETLVWTSWVLLAGLGVLAAVCLWAAAPTVAGALDTSPELRSEASRSLALMALALPFVLHTAGLRGLLQAQQRFDLLALVQAPAGVLNYAAPVLVLPFSSRVDHIAAALLAQRVLVWAGHQALCLRSMPSLASRPAFSTDSARRLVGFGGWLTVTNVIGPVMTYMDRFLVAAIAGVASVAFYITPYSIVVQVGLVATSVAGVLFPYMSQLAVRGDSALAGVYHRATTYVFLAVAPLLVVLAALSHEVMGLWLGEEFAARSAPVLSVLAIGALANCVAQVPFALIQAGGRPRATAIIHTLELAPYLGAVVALTQAYGILGTALAWAGRAVADAGVLFAYAESVLPPDQRGLSFAWRLVVGAVALAAVGWLAGRWSENTVARVPAVVGAVCLGAGYVWLRWLGRAESDPLRTALVARLGWRRAGG